MALDASLTSAPSGGKRDLSKRSKCHSSAGRGAYRFTVSLAWVEMRIDYRNRVVFLSNEKVASTSLERAILRYCDMIGRVDGNPKIKHINFEDFQKIKGVLHADGFKTVCVVRHPVDKAWSWYRYRSRDSLVGTPRSTRDVSFEDFVASIPARLVDDRTFVYDPASGRGADLIFKYDRLDALVAWLKGLYGDDFELQVENKSPERAKPAVPAKFISRFEDAMRWYEALPDVPADLTEPA